ncbi:PREDICTED: uncharacterized protein LOC104759928 [Camelina sativa]|uniref:Uncharacterized protein LOC104759928 n=1 Tax=Camelina sativa TaxID=90675 RepID=A0ABM0X5M8_CAMSA|nr:PREDICTED: uncharacterized protein LOC104759928 [Camelina sativa]
MASSSNKFHYHYDPNNDSLNQYFQEQFNNQFEAVEEAIPVERKPREYIDRKREEGHERLWNDYFSDNPTYDAHHFRRRFRMNKPLFLRIVNRLSEEVPYFKPKKDATFRNGLSPLQQCTAAIRLLAYGTATDSVDEYIRLAACTARKCLEHFVVGIVDLFGTEYLRRPTAEDLQRLLFTRSGRHLLNPSHNHNIRNIVYLHKNKKVHEKMLSVHLESCNLGSP